MATLRLQRRAQPLCAVSPPAALCGPLGVQGERPARASSGNRLRAGLHLERPRRAVRDQREARADRVEADLPELHRRLPRGRARNALRPTHAPPALREERSAGPGDDGRSGREDGAHQMAFQGRSHRVSAVARRPRPLLRLVGPQGLRAQRAQATQSDDLEPRDRRQGGRGPGIRERDRLRGHVRRSGVRVQRAHRTTALARRVVFAVWPPGVLLRDAGRRLRTRLPRQHRRHGLRLRGDHRAPALGPSGRDLCLLGARGLAQDGLRRVLGRVLLGTRRADRRLPVALQRSGRDHGRADRPGRPRLLLDFRPLLSAAPEAREERAQEDLRAQRTDRGSNLAVS